MNWPTLLRKAFATAAIELVAVDGQMTLTAIVPGKLLIHGNPDQVGHDFCKPMIVVSFDPHYFDPMAGV